MGRGLGKALMKACFARAEEAKKTSVRLTVNEHSTQSLPFYLSLGFEVRPILVYSLKVISGIRCFMFFIFLSSILIFRLK
jgi:ribosomal protein S18 acetylase RimI-like enzyme